MRYGLMYRITVEIVVDNKSQLYYNLFYRESKINPQLINWESIDSQLQDLYNGVDHVRALTIEPVMEQWQKTQYTKELNVVPLQVY